jgi:hypothetical protein
VTRYVDATFDAPGQGAPASRESGPERLGKEGQGFIHAVEKTWCFLQENQPSPDMEAGRRHAVCPMREVQFIRLLSLISTEGSTRSHSDVWPHALL